MRERTCYVDPALEAFGGEFSHPFDVEARTKKQRLTRSRASKVLRNLYGLALA